MNFGGRTWSAQKVNWIVDPEYRGGLILVRGGQLDGQSEVPFQRGGALATELRLRGTGSHPSETLLRTPGCYAYQINGFGVSRTIAFEARQGSPASNP